MELSFIHNRLKSNGVGMSKERLMDVLDQLVSKSRRRETQTDETQCSFNNS